MSGRFFHFPLPLLSAPDAHYRLTLQRIISWCCAHEGARIAREIGGEETMTRLASFEQDKRLKNLVLYKREHCEIALGMLFLQAHSGDMQVMVQRAQDSAKLMDQVEQTDVSGKRSPHVFIGAQLLWDCHNDESPSWRDFTHLCAQ